MTVRELQELLAGMPPDAPVVVFDSDYDWVDLTGAREPSDVPMERGRWARGAVELTWRDES